MQVFRYTDRGFAAALAKLDRRYEPSRKTESSVREIISKVQKSGDRALIDFTAKFGGPLLTPKKLRVSEKEIAEAVQTLSPRIKRAITQAHNNVKRFAKLSMRKDWKAKNAQGVQVGERFDPFQRVGIYVPAGTAPLASTAIMTVPLAAAVGVPEIVVVTPADKQGKVNPAVLYALQLSGATEIYKVGGAQAIAALAYGTKTIRPVAKIYGPGNSYVVEAKRQVFGAVAVDLLPGPSEILILADATANPAWIAADMLAQAEHGHGSTVGLITDSSALITKVEKEISKQLSQLSRQAHLAEVVKKYTFLVHVKNLQDGVKLVNDFAPEHVSIICKDEEKLAKEIQTSGAIFLGGMSPVVGGDFIAGPSHELPTGGAGKSFPGLTVDQFQRRTSIVRFDKKSLSKSLKTIQVFSEIEGLDAHGRSASIRLE